MNDKPISDLRRRMLEDMIVRRLGEKTQHNYLKHVEAFKRLLDRWPGTTTAEDLRALRLSISEAKTSVREPGPKQESTIRQVPEGQRHGQVARTYPCVSCRRGWCSASARRKVGS